MIGTFLLGEKKVRPGVYFRRERRGTTVEGATNGILACIFQSNWGALNKVVDVTIDELNNLEELYGDGATILREGFIGGARLIRAVRVGGDDGTASTITLKLKGSTLLTENPTADIATGDKAITRGDSIQNGLLGDDGDTPSGGTATTDAVELSARFVGNREFTVSVQDNLATGKRQLTVYEGTDIFTSVSFEAGGDEVQALVDVLATNKYFTATKKASGALADVTQAAMTAGTNPTVTPTSYSNATELLERFRWNCVVADADIIKDASQNDVDIRGILYTFVKQSYETGHLGFACIAGKSTETLEDRMTYAASINDEKVVYVLSGWRGLDGTIYDGWKAAARIGGMIAGCESNTSLTHATIANALELNELLSNGEIIRAEQKGCMVLSLNADDQVQIDNAINTLITAGTDLDDGWKKIRRTKTRFELMDRINRTHDRLVGKVNNDSNGRGTIIAAAQKIINEMIAEHKLVTGSYVEEDSAHPPEGDSAWFLLHILDLDSLEKVYLTYIFRYGQTFDED